MTFISLVIVLLCCIWGSESNRLSVKGPNALEQWKFFACLTLMLCFIVLFSFSTLVYRNPYDMQMVQKIYADGYMLLSPTDYIAIQNRYKCCGRNFYNETVCINGVCESSAVIDHCVKQFYFTNKETDGGCVPHLMESFRSSLLPSGGIHFLLFLVFIVHNAVFLVYLCAAGSLVDYSFIDKKKKSA